LASPVVEDVGSVVPVPVVGAADVLLSVVPLELVPVLVVGAAEALLSVVPLELVLLDALVVSGPGRTRPPARGQRHGRDADAVSSASPQDTSA